MNVDNLGNTFFLFSSYRTISSFFFTRGVDFISVCPCPFPVPVPVNGKVFFFFEEESNKKKGKERKQGKFVCLFWSCVVWGGN